VNSQIIEEIRDLNMLLANVYASVSVEIRRRLCSPAETKKLKAKVLHEAPGISLGRKLEENDAVPPYIQAQRIQLLKKLTLDRAVKAMRAKAEAMRAKLQEHLRDLKSLEPFSQSSNLLWRKQKAGEDQLFLNIFNPYYHERVREESRYLISHARFEEEVREQSQGRRVFLEMVINLGGVNRVTVATEDLCVVDAGEHRAIRQALLNLGELRIFEKLRRTRSRSSASRTK
jgi:hypothetical protein